MLLSSYCPKFDKMCNDRVMFQELILLRSKHKVEQYVDTITNSNDQKLVITIEVHSIDVIST